MRRVRVRAVAAGAAIAVAASLLAACGSDSSAGNEQSDTITPAAPAPSNTAGGSVSSEAAPSSTAGGSPSSASAPSSGADAATSSAAESSSSGGPVDLSQDTKKSLTIPVAAGWAEDIAVTHLWKYVLEQKGYTVDTPTVDIGPIFLGVSKGDYDIFFDTWLPNTHKKYWAQFGDKVDDINVWYDKAPLTIAVPDYMKIDSLADLKSIGDKVNKTIIGIDPGAGLTDVTQNSMMPAYGLTDAGWTLKTSSSAAMLAALKKAIDAKAPIVVTLWRPHWAYAAFPIKDLKDPKGAMGAPDSIHVIGSKAFAKADPGLLSAPRNFHMDGDTLNSLENVVLQEYGEGKYQEGVAAWAKDHQDFMKTLLG